MSPQDAARLVGHVSTQADSMCPICRGHGSPNCVCVGIPSITDHAAIDALADRSGVHRGAVVAVIKAMGEAG